ncbi:MAG: isochorismatase family protein [Mycoplasma sp.]
MKCIIVVDVQNDFGDNGSLPVKGGSLLADEIYELLNKIDRSQFKIVFSRDWHPAGHVSFDKWPPHCVASTYGSEFIGKLNDYKYDLLINKGISIDTDSYSIYNNEGSESIINKFIAENKIDEIFVCGLVKDICVVETANDLSKYYKNVSIITDLTIALDEKKYLQDKLEDINEIISNMIL